LCCVNFSPEAARNICCCMALNCLRARAKSETKILNRYIFKTAACIKYPLMPFFITIRNTVRSNLLVHNLFRIPCRPSKTFVSFYAAVCKFERPKHTSRSYCRFSLKLRNIFINGFMPFLTDIIAINSVIFSFLCRSVVQKLRA